jgi:hypothetical protein
MHTGRLPRARASIANNLPWDIPLTRSLLPTLLCTTQWRHKAPTKWIPSMMWARQFKEGELGIKEP